MIQKMLGFALRNVEAGGKDYAQMDLTEGVTWKKLILYAGPVVLSSLLQSAYSITDLIVAGWFIGKDGISAINNASQVMMILTQIIMGITTGGNILMGQYFGSKDRSNRVKTNRTMFGFALSAGALLSVLLFLLSRPILSALRAPRWRRLRPISRCVPPVSLPSSDTMPWRPCSALWATPSSPFTVWP